MKILFIGDVIGEPGRHCLASWLPRLRQEHQPDFVIVNAENAAGGFGLTP
ncbi:MAG: YmdB family metallophosphoesterase, partial [Candidatus Firestonebacteria bacterium]|nr:YmdB family metallophosphoesterase [Candidatus Firestonebacteria bacterium]